MSGAVFPPFECPDEQFQATYHFRSESFLKHLKETPEGWVITEFLPDVPWAGIYNTISCAAGHHLYEGRWLHDPKFVEEYARFWMLPEAKPRLYSFWAADAVRAVALVSGHEDLTEDLLPNLVANYRAWERTNRDVSGLFHQVDDRDGMEFSLGGSGFRPSINSYMYGEAIAIAAMATGELAAEFRDKAAAIKKLLQTRLWSEKDRFFETANVEGPVGIREEVGFIPWYFNLPDPQFVEAWKQLFEPDGFASPFGPTTVERRAAGFMKPENHDCLWNGPSWPYATTQTLVAMANVLNGPEQSVVSKRSYFDQLVRYARSHQRDGKPWIAEDLDAETGKWIVDLPRSEYYNHSGFIDLVISGLVGIRPRSDHKLELNPLLPEGTWPWFSLQLVPYRDHSLDVFWDVEGNRFGKGPGLSLIVDGNVVAHRKDLGPLTTSIEPRARTKKVERWQKHEGPVLGGSLGTCFDLTILEDGKHKMYFSWRPKQSIALTESEDGVHWSEPQIVLGPASTGWEDDMNRPAVVKHGGKYHMWYTGQSNGHSAIGYATSDDGIRWVRLEKPVLEADQPWEKVAVMCPSVLWDEKAKEFRMWFSGGEQYEPDAIGYAVSPDGIHWEKRPTPIFEADPHNRWERHKVTACQVLVQDGWHVMFYIGFRDLDHAQIGIARSKDGISNWERLGDNPIVGPTVDGWDADACYKPFALYDKAKDGWMLWYNGRHGGFEQIGLATKKGFKLGF